MKFMLDGCDISFIAEAPGDITLKQLLKQADRIHPDYCACGIRSLYEDEIHLRTEVVFDYNDVRKTSDNVGCTISESVTEETK